MSGWDDAGELFAEGIDWAVEHHYDRAHDGIAWGAHKTGDRWRRLRKQPAKYGPNGERLADSEQPQPAVAEETAQDSKSNYTSGPDNYQSPQRSSTDQYGQPRNPYSGGLFSEDERARDLASQGQIAGPNYSPRRPSTARSVQAPPQYARSRGIDGAMGDSGYGPAEQDYGRNPQSSRGYDDGYEGDGADDYRRAYRPDRPQPPQPYDPSRYVPHGAAGVAAASQYSAQAPRDQRYLPPPPAVPRAYDDPYDDGYDSYDSDNERRRHARKSRSEMGLRRRDSRDSRDSRSRSRGARSERNRGSDDDEDGERGHSEKHGPKHKTAATIGGALVGALAGYQISNRRGKPEGFHTIAGAIVGAVGAREADKWWEHRQEEKREHEHHRHEREEEKEDRDDRYQF